MCNFFWIIWLFNGLLSNISLEICFFVYKCVSKMDQRHFILHSQLCQLGNVPKEDTAAAEMISCKLAVVYRIKCYLRVRREYANLPSPPPFTSCHCLHKAHGVLAYGLEMKLLYLIVHRIKQFSRLATKSFFVCKFRLLQTELLMLPPLRQKVFLLYALCQNKTK